MSGQSVREIRRGWDSSHVVGDQDLPHVPAGPPRRDGSVERLAAQVGISRSTFYVHFPDKGELARKLAASVLAELHEVSSRWWRVAEHADRADLGDSITAVVDIYRRHAAVTAVAEAATYDSAVAEELRSRVQQIIEATRAAIERGRTAVRDVAPAETAAVLTWMVERAGYQLVRGGDPADDPQIVQVLTDVIWTTLYSGATAPPA